MEKCFFLQRKKNMYIKIMYSNFLEVKKKPTIDREFKENLWKKMIVPDIIDQNC